MKKLLVAALAVLALAGCNDVNGVSSKSFIQNCYAKGGVPIILKEGDIKIHTGQFCIKKDAIINYNTDQ